MSEQSFEGGLQAALPGIFIGMSIAVAWWWGIGYVLAVSLYAAQFGGGFTPAVFFLSPALSVVGIALIFSYFKNHNVVTGILLVSIGFSLFLTVPAAKNVVHQVGAWYADARR